MYAASLVCLLVFSLAGWLVEPPFRWLFWLAALGSAYFTLSSLLVSFWVYDWSGFYRWKWLPAASPKTVLNIHAGFDESSRALHQRYPSAELTVLDFYDAARHTEPSIARARAFLPPLSGTLACSTCHLPLEDQSQDLVFLIFAAHEIRDAAERKQFFGELRRVCRGRIYLVEHQRDLANFLAFGPGFQHFHSPAQWRQSWTGAGLKCLEERFFTPFVRIFVLQGSSCST
mgnify:CR=1 FL=1